MEEQGTVLPAVKLIKGKEIQPRRTTAVEVLRVRMTVEINPAFEVGVQIRRPACQLDCQVSLLPNSRTITAVN